MNTGLEKRKVFITGAGRGIGRKVKETFEQCGSIVTAPGRAQLDLSDREKICDYLDANEDLYPDIGTKPLTFQLQHANITAKPAIGDQQAALYGAGLDREDTLSFNIGTGAQVSRIIHSPNVSGSYQIRPYMEEGIYLQTIPHLPAGRALNVYLRLIKDILQQFEVVAEEERIWEVLLKAEEYARPGKLQCDMSFFENALTDDTFGSITDIEEYGLTAGNLMHAAFRQMAANFIMASDRIAPDRQKIRHIVFSGGIAGKIEKVRKYLLDYFPKDTEVFIASDETLIGLYKYGTK